LIVAGSIASVALTTALVACRASIKLGEGMPGAGTEAEVEIDPIGDRGKVPAQGGLADGDCVKITFYGPNGENLGSTETEVGKEFDIPAGADGGKVDPCDPPPEKKKKAKRAISPTNLVAQGPGRFGYGYIPFDLTDGQYHYADFWVTAPTREAADVIADDFILGMLSEAPPAGVEPVGVVEVEVEADYSVQVSMFSTGQPETLAFEWNEAALYDLDDAVVTSAGGWYVTTVVVPPALVDIDLVGTSDNAFRYRLGLPSGDEVGTSASVAVTQ
jgi:hypothetical protein